MSFDAREETINKILGGDSKFIIPRNQRKYVWTEKQWRELFLDMEYIYLNKTKNSDANTSHFFGSFLFQEEKKDNNIVIDGQQRITTLMIILTVLCFIFKNKKEEEESGLIRKYLIGNIGLGSQFIRLTNESVTMFSVIVKTVIEQDCEINHEDLVKKIPFEKYNEEDKKILNCFNYFHEKFKSYQNEDLKNYKEIILDMKVVKIVSKDELDCYNIFEILNSRGLELNADELLKNFILKHAQPDYTIDFAKAKWEDMERNIESCQGKMDLFLQHFATYKYEKPGKNGAFKIIKSNVEPMYATNLLNELVEVSVIYKSFYEPNLQDNTEIIKCLNYFKLMNHRQFRPLFLALFSARKKKNISDKQLIEIMNFLKNFYFAFGTICKKTSNNIENKVYSYALKIETEFRTDIVKELKDELREYYPNKEDFINSFKKIGYSNKNKKYKNSNNKKIVDYIFMEIEEKLELTKEKKCNNKNCSVEHIMLDDENNYLPCMIGNLFLIDTNINKKMTNKSFAEKIPYLKKSELAIVKNFVKNYGNEKEWTEDFINKRGVKLAELAYDKIWKI